MTGTQSSIWELLDIAPTQDVKIVAEAVAAQINQYDEPAKIQQLEAAWDTYRSAQKTQADQANLVSKEPSLISEKSESNALEKASADESFNKATEALSVTPNSELSFQNSMLGAEYASAVCTGEANTNENINENTEAVSQANCQVTPPVTLQSQVETFLNRMLKALNTSEQPHEVTKWETILNDPSLTDPTFVDAANFSVFHLIVSQHHSSDAVLPNDIGEQLSHIFNWREQESSLRRYFSNDEVEAGLGLIYGNAYVAPTSSKTQAKRLSSQGHVASARRNFAIYALFGVMVLFLFIGLNQVDLSVASLGEEEAPVLPTEPYWAEDLTVCNQAKPLAEDEAFAQCLALAEQGRVFAQMRVAWLFFKSEDEDHLQISYDWMSKAGNYDDTSKLLSAIMLLAHGTTAEDKLKGYKGIIKQADSGFAGAEAYLALLYLLDQNLLEKTANPVWLLEKAHRSDVGYVGVWDLLRIYLNGLETRVDKNKAVALIRDYADSFFPTSANNAAWMIATSKDLDVFKSSDAVQWAESVVQDPNYSDNFGFVDTLAAAYAADGQFERAIAKQKQAIALLEQSEYRNETDLKEFNSRLAAFSGGQSVAYFDMVIGASQLFPAMKQKLERLLLEELKLATTQP